MIDLLITNGMVVDGTGSPGFFAAVAVEDDRVSIHRGDVSALEAARTIDASGYVVCPGFVDLHSHAGLTILGEPHHDPKVRPGSDDRAGGHRRHLPRAVQDPRGAGAGTSGWTRG